MTEIHPFGDFVPKNTKYLLLGSFTGKRSEADIKDGYDWFYGTKRNQFWPILEDVFAVPLRTKKDKQKLFSDLNLAITDIILSCERRSNSNLDMNLINIVFNREGVEKIFKSITLETVYFSSRFVENLFRRNFKNLLTQYPTVKFITLPSPSPRYAAMTRGEKVARYKEVLPRLGI